MSPLHGWDCDELDSDDLDAVLELSKRETYKGDRVGQGTSSRRFLGDDSPIEASTSRASGSKPARGRSVFQPSQKRSATTETSTLSRTGGRAKSQPKTQNNPRSRSKAASTAAKASTYASNRLHTQIEELDAEIMRLDAVIRDLTEQREECVKRKAALSKQAGHTEDVVLLDDDDDDGELIDYTQTLFPWSQPLEVKMRNIFGIQEFRLCQRGVCNANMDGRDIVCIMPTGGGKSLTYQLPALLADGVTLVVSPLISLMTDQILHLKDNNVHAAMVSSSTPKAEKDRTMADLRKLASSSASSATSSQDGIKLCYVTPEKLAKDMTFKSLLQRIDENGKLARIVIDEAHCVSQLGHDFRPDYQKLHELRKLYPRVPIMALSATCGPAVLRDLIKTLGLRDVVDGKAANRRGTVYFSSPLYRKNLHYVVKPKREKGADHLEDIRDYILEHHPDDTGIIYCFTIKDSETVAQKLREMTQGRIKTGVYNAQVADAQKQALHEQWRNGVVKVVCATIAFGLGIDKGDVRFVIHHSMSKSLEGFYQESGRAGRDGQDSDCVLYYRPQDFSNLACVTSKEKEGQEKLHAMLDFAENLETCRKVQFAKYFSHSSQTSISSWSTSEEDALDPCGHCDNCRRVANNALTTKDVTFEVWQVLQIAKFVRDEGGRLTLGMLAGLARGSKGGKAPQFDVATGRGKRKSSGEKMSLDVDAVAGGPVDMNRGNLEHLIVRLLPLGYLTEEFVVTSYSSIAYLKPTSSRLLRLSLDQAKSGSQEKIEMSFIEEKKGKGKASPSGPKKQRKTKTSEEIGTYFGTQRQRNSKGKNVPPDAISISDSDSDDMYDEDIDEAAWVPMPESDVEDEEAGVSEPVAKKQRREPPPGSLTPFPHIEDMPLQDSSETESEGEGAKWEYSFGTSANGGASGAKRVADLTKQKKTNGVSSKPAATSKNKRAQPIVIHEVLELSD